MDALRRVLGLGAIVAMGLSARAQDVAFLTPSQQTAEPGAAVDVHVERGPDRAPVRVAWPGERAGWMFISARGNQENRHGVKADDPAGDTVSIHAPDSGVAVVGVDLDPVVVAVGAEEFAKFRAGHLPPPPDGAAPTGGAPKGAAAGADAGAAVKAGAGPVRVRRFETLNTLIRAREPGREASPSPIATAKTGQKASIRPLMDPTGLRAGSEVPFRVYTDGRAVSGAKLTATSVATGETRTVAADSSGIAKVLIDSTGVWRVEFHHAVPSPDADADWNLFSATLTFEVTRAAKGGE